MNRAASRKSRPWFEGFSPLFPSPPVPCIDTQHWQVFVSFEGTWPILHKAEPRSLFKMFIEPAELHQIGKIQSSCPFTLRFSEQEKTIFPHLGVLAPVTH